MNCAVANHDPCSYDHPLRFDLDRDPRRGPSFLVEGASLYWCAGASNGCEDRL